MENIVGLTIGPIVKTILSAKKTGQLWGSSYIFSYLMKSIINEFNNKSLIDKRIIPASVKKKVERIGIYPDRLIFMNESLDKNDIKKEIDSSIDSVIENMAKNFNNKEDKEEIKQFLKTYFQIHYAIIPKDSLEENIIFEMNKILDNLELNYSIMPEETNNYLMEELHNDIVKTGFLAKDAGLDKNMIKSIEAIAQTHDSKAKYYAIVQSDGDNVGKIIESIGNNIEKLQEFSKLLNDYIIEAAKLLNTYGAFTLYAGGDDLLFFAPLKGIVENKMTNIYELLNELNKVFKNTLREKFPNVKVSLSFGIGITYFKYPLYEGLSNAGSLLFGTAKNFRYNDNKKNAIATQIIKNSGQSIQFTFNQSSKVYKKFNALLSHELPTENDDLKSIKNNFRDGNAVLESLFNKGRPINSYFVNNYNEVIHTKYNNYINQIISIVESYSREAGNIKPIDIYSILEIKDFILKGDDNNE